MIAMIIMTMIFLIVQFHRVRSDLRRCGADGPGAAEAEVKGCPNISPGSRDAVAIACYSLGGEREGALRASIVAAEAVL